MENEKKKYYLGLDIGTNSVGWAVTDENYKLIKKQGKHLWGARLFKEGKDASSRRTARNKRRRLKRRRERILILRDLFKDEINRIDPNFFHRLDLSFFNKKIEGDIELAKDYLKIESDVKDNYLFESKKQVKEYYKKYPTIYHLRKALMEEDRKFDIREIYLALSHMIKYRGNFLYPNFSGVDSLDLLSKFENINELLDLTSEGESIKFNIDKEKEEKIKEIYKKEGKKSVIKDEIKEILNCTDKRLGHFIELANGSSKKIKDLFPNKEDLEDDELKIDLNNENYVETIETYLDENEILLIENIKEIFDIRNTLYTLKGEKNISNSMVNLYKNHKEQLKKLKYIINKYIPSIYKDFFLESPNKEKKKKENTDEKKKKENTDEKKKKFISYSQYIGSNNNEKFKLGKDSINYDDFINKFIKNITKAIKELKIEENDLDIINKIEYSVESNSFLQKQNSKNNGTLPYQLNKIELYKIIENQGKYYPFLKNKAKSFIDPNKEEYKLVSLLEYKIPYFVGPLSNKNKSSDKNLSNHWAVKKNNEKILPWNFYDVVDEEKSSEAFMNNLLNKDTYILNEETLPKKSLYFQAYSCIGELNSFLLNGKKFVDWKIEDTNLLDILLKEIYLNKKNVKFKDIENKIRETFPTKEINITTKNLESDNDKLASIIKSDLSSYIDFKNIFGEDFYLNKDKFDLVETIIKYLSIFTEERPLTNALHKLDLSEGQIDKIKKLKGYTGFSPFSKKLLVGIEVPVPDKFGEMKKTSILTLMFKYGYQFMEIYESKDDESGNNKFGFKKEVENLNNNFLENENLTPFDQIDEYPLSNIAKRPLRQVYKIVSELNHILNKDKRDENNKINAFSKIFIETTRKKEESKEIASRKKQLEPYIKAAKGALNEVEIKNLNEELNKNESNLKSKKVFLYFLQLGRDVYTGEKIDLATLLTNNNVYDIDHIIPQSLLKNDSISNTVLTSKKINNKLQNIYPYSYLIDEKGKEWIKTLNKIRLKNKAYLMPNNKMDAILRKEPISEDELSGFINRQLPSTSQANKYSFELLKSITSSELIYSKASNVSDFRNIFDLFKIREINNFHHAHDALLNIVVGDIYDQKFTSLKTRYTIAHLKEVLSPEEFDRRTNLDPERIFKWEIKGRDNTKVLWEKPHLIKEGLKDDNLKNFTNPQLELIKKQLSYNDVLVSYMRRTQVDAQGMFNKISFLGNGDGAKNYIKYKDHPVFDPIKYGGQSDVTTSYFILVSKFKKDKKIYNLLPIQSNISVKIGENYNLNDYLKDKYEKENYKLEVDKILINDLISYPIVDSDYSRVYIIAGNTGLPGYLNPHYSLNKEYEYLKYIKDICSLFKEENKKNLNSIKLSDDKEKIIFRSKEFTLNDNLKLFNHLKGKLNIFTTKETIKDSCIKFINNFDLKQLPLYYYNEKEKAVNLPQEKFLYDLICLLSGDNPKFNDYKYITSNGESISGASDWGKASFTMNNLPVGTKFIKLSPTGFYKKVLFEVK